MNLRVRLGIEWLVIALLATGIVTAATLWRGTQSFDNLLYDQLIATDRAHADPDILLVTIDDNSLATIGKWPWNRAVHAQMMEKLQAAKPRSILFDVLLSEKGDADGDAKFATALAGGAPVMLPLHFVTPGSDGKAYDTELPEPAFRTAAKGIGQVNVAFDDDGIVRRAALCFRTEERARKWPHIAELSYRGDSAKPSPAYRRLANCEQEYLIPYAAPGSFAEISYSNVLAGNVPVDLVQGRDIIIGATASGMGDNFPVPNASGGLLSGIEIIANMLGALKRDDFIKPMGTALTLVLSLLPVWLLLLAFLYLRPRMALVASFASILIVVAVSALILRLHIWLPPGAALIGILLVYPLWGWRRLQAMSDFMASELETFRRDDAVAALPLAGLTTDLVGRQSEALTGAIGHMRDLRRFVSDTLSDLPDPMFVTDPQGVIAMTNDALDARHGEYIIGMNMADALEEQVAPEYRNAVREYLTTKQADGDFVRFMTQAGDTLVLRRSQIRDDAGALRGHIHYLTDISQLARAEQQREEVLQLLSHDMRAPQSAIIAALDGPIDEATKDRIGRNARRTMQLAQDFVDMARMTETEFDGEDVLLADMLREAADGLWPLAKERDIAVNVVDESNAAFIVAEPDSLSRAFCNLIDNAIKFSPDGSIIDISVQRGDPGKLLVTFRDRGPGIDADILPKLFARFATAGEHQGRVKGAGLGLAYVDAVIRRHGGTIEACNAPEGGACFNITLDEAPD